MAVYKPSNCVPFLSCWDLTQPQYISGELNTSNETVTGYKVRVLDSENNTIFEGSEFNPINFSDKVINSGLNGSILTLPLIVSVDNLETADAQYNFIYYQKGQNKWYGFAKNSFYEISNFSNNYPDQPYKWQITLAQGQQNIDGVLEQQPSDEYFDMVIDEAKILGSTGNRIQSWLSENIYKDYYIQLYDASNNELGVRTRISSYDHSYGFIYPQENTISQELVDSASYFKIFKDTNDPQYVSTARLINYRLKTDIDKVVLDGKFPINTESFDGRFKPSGDPSVVSNPYFTQVYDGDVTSNVTYGAYTRTENTTPLAEGTTFLLMYQGDTNTEPKDRKSVV